MGCLRLGLDVAAHCAACHLLFSIEECFPQEFRKERNYTRVGEEETIITRELSSGIIWAVFALELVYSDHLADEIDALFGEKILVHSLRVFCDETDGGNARVDERICKGTAQLSRL